MTWNPILTDSLRSESVACIRQIAQAMRYSPPKGRSRHPALAFISQDPTLVSGASGLSLFFGYLAQGLDEPAWELDAIGYLEQAMETASKHPDYVSLYHGISGVGWTYSHLQRGAEQSEVDAIADIDDLLIACLRHPNGRGGYFDLIGGLTGITVYALERLPRPTAKDVLTMVVDRLAEQAVELDGGAAWPTAPELTALEERNEFPDGHYNLGVAHGQPGVIAVLAHACRAGVRVESACPLLNKAVKWLLEQQLSAESPSVFAPRVAAGHRPVPARSAWCYGDPGVAAALLAAARCVREPLWETEAIKIAKKAALRDPDQAGIEDTGLCHGAAGLAHLFNRLYQATGESDLLQASRLWFARTLDMRTPGRGIAGFCNYETAPSASSVNPTESPGFLMGAAGIGLALLGAVTSVEPRWDQVLAVSISDPINNRGEKADG